MRPSFFSPLRLLLACAVLTLLSCEGLTPDTATVVRGDGTVYRGTLSGRKPSGYGVLLRGDSTVYAGQWSRGLRSGQGYCRDSLGRRVLGRWKADTLLSGLRADSAGTYEGMLSRSAMPAGHGTYLAADGRYYAGSWTAGCPDGFGFSIVPGRRMRVGDWRAGRYLGERLEYTTDRIYGIDVSRFQHDVGRKKYPIDWSRVRITHLGTLSRKRVSGQVDYPVSFCYIKSTEGTTVRNPYYRSDYAAARRHGVRVGSYHFFSTRTPAEAQARYFLKSSTFSKGDFPPVLDLEPTEEQIRRAGGAEALFRSVRTWLRLVAARTGTRPVLYVGQGFVNRHLVKAPDLKRDYNIWIARYGEFKPDVHLAFWQLCPDGRVEGIRPQVDINVFNGYRDEFDEFCRTQLIP